jgi:hypothetical protein
MNIQAKFDLVNQQSSDRIMHYFKLREADCLSCKPLNPCSETEFFAINILGVAAFPPHAYSFQGDADKRPNHPRNNGYCQRAQAMLSAF